MAVTSIWYVSERVDHVVSYVVNPDKTVEKPELTPEAIAARKAVGDVINYASNADKTEQMMYVTGINCNPDTAADQFLETKLYWDKTGGRLAYHGYQSFLEGEGEITAEKAHEIGVKLARELWGDRFEVVVATHLNTGHYHNHLLVNSVSFVDGLKYRRTKADYRQMRMVSDRLCREANLHIVEDPSGIKGKSYDEWRAERQGKLTVRGTIRQDINYAIKLSHREKEFWDVLRKMGYEFKFFRKDGSMLEHPGIKPPGAANFFRLDGLGPDYDYDSLRRRIVENTLVLGTPLLFERKEPSPFDEQPKGSGLPYTYRRYCIRLYSFICKPVNSQRDYIPMVLREDIAKLDRYIEQMDFLYQHKIEDKQSLQGELDSLQNELKALYMKRKELYSAKKYAVRHHDGAKIEQTKCAIRDNARKIRELKKQIKLCDAVFISSDRVLEAAEAPMKEPEIRPVNTNKMTTRPQIQHDSFGKSAR